MALKTLPHNTDAEKTVLGAMIRSEEKLYEGLGWLQVDDFYPENENNKIIFETMLNLRNKHLPIDVRTITDELINSKQIDKVGGVEYLQDLVDSVVTLRNFKQYVKIIQNQAALRKYLVKMNEYQEKYNKGIDNPSLFLKEMDEDLHKLARQDSVAEFQDAQHISNVLNEQLQSLKIATSSDDVIGTTTGYKRLNYLTNGFQKGQFIILAARTGVGKTAFALNLMYNAATRQNKTVAYFSLEMPATDLFKRLVSKEACIPHRMLLTGQHFDNRKKLAVQQSCERLGQLSIFVDDTSGLQILDLCAKVRSLKEREKDKLGLVIVDYIGLVHTSLKTRNESRQLEVQYVSQTLKNLALELEIPIIGVCQLNRNAETNKSGKPSLIDLRESGSLEQDADLVMLLSKGKTSVGKKQKEDKAGTPYNQAAQKALDLANQVAKQDGDDAIVVDIQVAKNRNGSQGDCYLIFRKDYCSFEQPTEEQESQITQLEEEALTANLANNN